MIGVIYDVEKWKTAMRHNVVLAHDLNTVHGSSGRHIRFCYRADDSR
jgi:hypothetical protein